MDRRTFLTIAVAAPVFGQSAKPVPRAVAPGVPWTQWGGPHRNFHTEATGLKDTWPAAGPRVVWKRPLGEGYSSPAVEEGVLYTMYAKPREEVVLAADAETGKTLWEHTDADDVSERCGEPKWATARTATPLDRRRPSVHRRRCRPASGPGQEDRQTAVDAAAVDRSWRLELMYGYASSPIAFRDTVDRPGRWPGKALMAFQQSDGTVAWGRNDLRQRVLVPDAHQRRGARAAGSADGRRGSRGQSAQWRPTVAGAVQGRLFDRRGDAGLGCRQFAVRVLRVRRRRKSHRGAARGLQTTATELWSSTRLRLHHGNAIRIGDTIYFSSGARAARRF